MKQKSHDPFKLRERIVFVGFGMLVLFAFLFKNTWAGLSGYALGVTLMDALLTYFLKLKSSKYAIKEHLLVDQKISPKNFDRYCTTISNVRLISTVASALIASLLLIKHYVFFQSFFLGYFVLTFSGVIYIRRFTKMKKPVLVSFYELSAEEKRRASEINFSEEIIYSPKYSSLECNVHNTKRL